MADRPTVVRTYGKSRPSSSTASSSSMIFELSSPPTSPLITPKASSDSIDPLTSPSSPIIQSKKENAPLLSQFSTSRQSTLNGFFSVPTRPKKRPLNPIVNQDDSVRAVKREPTTIKHKEGFTQLHLTHLPLLHTCRECSMSYVRGGEDESLHDRHHARVTRGIIWEGLGRVSKTKMKGKEKELGWRVVKENVMFGPKGRGKIIVADGSFGGTKLDDILRTVDTVLSSPPLPPLILDQCRIFLFITASPAPAKRLRPGSHADRTPKERVVAVVVAQGIKWAMRVLSAGEQADGQAVDSGDGVLCDPARLDTPLGIHRLFTIPTYRSLGLAQLLLDAACQHTVYGCHFDPAKGEVAFSQPTNSGKAVMDKWEQGNVRVFVDDESQL